MVTSSLPDRVACYRHADHLRGAHCTRCGRPICDDCMIAVPVGHQCPTCVEEGPGAPAVAPGRRERFLTLTPVVAVLIAVNVAVFLLTRAHPTWQVHYAQIPSAVAHGQVYRLFTAAFLHENVTHLLFNMASLLAVGPPVERAMGRGRFLVLYLLAAVGGSVCAFVFGPALVIGVGASGAIFGIFGAWFSLARASRADTGVIVLLIGILLAYSFYDPRIDWRAHVGGLVTGVAVAAVMAAAAHWPRPIRLVTEAALVAAMTSFFWTLVVQRSSQL
ncbi:MAG TPA: rhomboid family intramembrane serine protease [Acidimicrobiales bacterium]|nr:rhomboid family intramembrane serine protease [Acidimicrobiales bacterium]